MYTVLEIMRGYFTLRMFFINTLLYFYVSVKKQPIRHINHTTLKLSNKRYANEKSLNIKEQ